MCAEAAGVYVHVPFCSAICPYCDFAVVRNRRSAHHGFVSALIAEVASRRDEIDGIGVVDTIYFGGGTPSVLGERHLAALLAVIDRAFDLAADTLIFFEANPEDVSAQSLAAWRALGIRVLTLGVQALDDPSLRFLGRRHTAEEARAAIEHALESGFDTVSFDLIYGLPDQSLDGWTKTLDRAAGLGSQHLSCYQLTIEPRTPFARDVESGALVVPTDSQQADYFFVAHERLAHHGFVGYEVSNLARARRHRSKHNQKYWRHVPYLGFGPSAHSFDGRTRRWNERHLSRWQRSLTTLETAIAGEETLSKEQLAIEAVLLGLRTRDGIELEDCRRRFGVDLIAGNEAHVRRQVEAGLLRYRESPSGSRVLAPTLHGMAVADSLTIEWTIDSEPSPPSSR